jgi:hypothetical protein
MSIYTQNITKDSYVRKDQTTTNFGSDTELAINHDTTYEYRIFLEAPTYDSTGKTINSIKLFLTELSGVNSSELEISTCNSSWTETGITFTNKPSVTDISGNFLSNVSGNLYSIDIPISVLNNSNGICLYSNYLYDVGHYYSSDDSTPSNRPYYEIDYTISSVTENAPTITSTSTVLAPSIKTTTKPSVITSTSQLFSATSIIDINVIVSNALGSSSLNLNPLIKNILTSTPLLSTSELLTPMLKIGKSIFSTNLESTSEFLIPIVFSTMPISQSTSILLEPTWNNGYNLNNNLTSTSLLQIPNITSTIKPDTLTSISYASTPLVSGYNMGSILTSTSNLLLASIKNTISIPIKTSTSNILLPTIKTTVKPIQLISTGNIVNPNIQTIYSTSLFTSISNILTPSIKITINPSTLITTSMTKNPLWLSGHVIVGVPILSSNSSMLFHEGFPYKDTFIKTIETGLKGITPHEIVSRNYNT